MKTFFKVHYWDQYNKEVDNEQFSLVGKDALKKAQQGAAENCEAMGFHITFTIEILRPEVTA